MCAKCPMLLQRSVKLAADFRALALLILMKKPYNNRLGARATLRFAVVRLKCYSPLPLVISFHPLLLFTCRAALQIIQLWLSNFDVRVRNKFGVQIQVSAVYSHVCLWLPLGVWVWEWGVAGACTLHWNSGRHFQKKNAATLFKTIAGIIFLTF